MAAVQLTPGGRPPEQKVRSLPSASELVAGILNDAQKLAQQQFNLFKVELKEDLARTKQAVEFGGIGLVLLTVGGLSLVASLVILLHEQLQISLGSSSLIIGGAAFLGGLASAWYARQLMHSFSPLPDKTIHALEENLTWKTQPET
jgi:uncharacterized membrane protein YqjE